MVVAGLQPIQVVKMSRCAKAASPELLLIARFSSLSGRFAPALRCGLKASAAMCRPVGLSSRPARS